MERWAALELAGLRVTREVDDILQRAAQELTDKQLDGGAVRNIIIKAKAIVHDKGCTEDKHQELIVRQLQVYHKVKNIQSKTMIAQGRAEAM